MGESMFHSIETLQLRPENFQVKVNIVCFDLSHDRRKAPFRKE